ncbi:Longitudinals lacking protein, isoforms N/O/W/X/Y, partial [Trachymyrmex zeteki]
ITMAAIVVNLRYNLRVMLIRLMVISVGMRDIIEKQINSHAFALILRFLCQLVQQFLAAGVIVITIMIKIKSSPSVAIAAAENINGRRPYIVIKGMNAERNRSTNAFIAITRRKYDRIGFVMKKLTQNLDADANRLRLSFQRYFNKQHIHWILEDKVIYTRKQGKRSSKSQMFVRFKHRPKKYLCDKCKKEYKNKGSLIRHTKLECGKPPQFNCPFCSHACKQKTNLLRHINNVHGRKKRRSRNALPRDHKRYNCHKCGIKSYVSKSTLNRHLREECNMEPQNSCPYCNKRIHQRCNFQRHMKKVHQNVYHKQTPLEILLDANIPVLCESISVSTEGSNVLSTDSTIWKKFQEMFEKETTKINIKLDSLSIKVESLVEDMKVVKNKIQLNQCEHLRRYVDYSTTLSKNITSMIKMVITRNVAIEYTASKVTPGKALMKDEHLYTCIEDILLQNEFQGEIVTTKLLLKALSTSLSNAKDWDGHRKDRDGQRKDRDGQRKDQ